MKFHILKHNCRHNEFARMLQIFISKGKSSDLLDQCPFYWKMEGGDGYTGNIHFFTFIGLRITVNTVKKKDLWTV